MGVTEMDQDDVEILVSGSEEEMRINLHAKEVKSVIAKVGITQTVLGFTQIIGGIIILSSWPEWGVDNLAEGLWCGAFVLISGPLSIAAYFYLHIALVITCLTMNILSSLLLLVGMVIAAVSAIENSFQTQYRYDAIRWSVGFIALNTILVSCFSLSIYIAVIYIRILVQKRDNYCNWCKQDQQSSYIMVYSPTSAHVPEYMKNVSSESLDTNLVAPLANNTGMLSTSRILYSH